MTPQELKISIFQKAIQGKLVDQRPEEGTGEELYQQIQIEKQRLIKAGTIKKEKPLPEIADDELPFDIPETWQWCRITDCGFFISGYTPKPAELASNGTIPYFKVSDMNTAGNELFLIYTGHYLKNLTSKCFLKNTIVYPKNGGAVFTNKKRILSQNSVVDLNTGGYYPIEPLDLMFVYIFFSNIDFRKCYKGTALPTIDMDRLKSKLIPLPPLAEQKRIVAKIEELLPYINHYEQAWSKLEDFNRRFPVDMQKSILQMAIQGKLVEQRPVEGTGEELYQQIQAEKQSLIKAGTIKKEKPLPEITEGEIPFDIPESWKWVHLQSLCSLIGDIDHNMPKSVDSKEGVLFLSAKDLLDDGTINYTDNVKYISQNDFERLSRKARPHRNDIIYSRIGAALGKARVVESDVTFLVSYSCCVIRPLFVDVRFLRYYLESPLILAHSVKARQSIGVPDLGMGEIKKYLVALPPLAEQKRIVAKLEEILPLCDRLK